MYFSASGLLHCGNGMLVFQWLRRTVGSCGIGEMNRRMGDRMYLKRWDWDQEKNQTIYHLVMTNIAMERSTIFKFGKSSISMGHLYGELFIISIFRFRSNFLWFDYVSASFFGDLSPCKVAITIQEQWEKLCKLLKSRLIADTFRSSQILRLSVLRATSPPQGGPLSPPNWACERIQMCSGSKSVSKKYQPVLP